MRYPERWPIDQSIFRRPRTRASAGTVLIDMSGSMELNEHDVDAILNATGAATLIAIYSGRGDQGELKVVARRGVRADAKDLKRFGAHNVVDAPALAWLGAQPKPRVWVSDGRVTGIGDAVSAEVTGLCRELCGRFAIRRVESAEEAGEVLRGRSTPVRVAVR